jgi:hypothetical protein
MATVLLYVGNKIAHHLRVAVTDRKRSLDVRKLLKQRGVIRSRIDHRP